MTSSNSNNFINACYRRREAMKEISNLKARVRKELVSENFTYRLDYSQAGAVRIYVVDALTTENLATIRVDNSSILVWEYDEGVEDNNSEDEIISTIASFIHKENKRD